MKNKKLVSAVIAIALAASILLGGTFAWQSINQQALNEVYGFVNPGGRLHDDFIVMDELTDEGTKQYDKNVYVENFTTLAEDGVQVFARVRLYEYMEFGTGAGNPGSTATSLIPGAVLDDKSTWEPYKLGEDSAFRQYWTMTMADEEDDSIWYMPTFNKDKDSLQADINGTFDAGFTDYVKYGNGEGEINVRILDAVYDDDADDVDNNGTKSVREEHQIAKTINGDVLSMQEWIDGGKKPGDYWVYDIDGWAYWANAIDPSTATGLLLDGIQRTAKPINEEWYYGINVVAQFITKEAIGSAAHNSGFYHDGETVSTNALKLLAAIGVDVNTTVTGGAADDPTSQAAAATMLSNALAVGGNVSIGGIVDGDTQVLPWGESNAQYTAEYCMSEGGALNGGTLKVNESEVFGLVIEAGAASNRSSTVNAIAIEGNSETVVYVGENGGCVTLNSVDVTANGGAGIYAEFAQGGVELNNCTVAQSGINANHDAWFETAVAAAQGANVVINGGTYTSSKYAVYVFTSGGTVTINDGVFNGVLKANNSDEIIIKGGMFSVDPSEYVAEGYKAVSDSAGTWTVTVA